MRPKKLREFKVEVGTWGDIDSLKNMFGLSTINNLELLWHYCEQLRDEAHLFLLMLS